MSSTQAAPGHNGEMTTDEAPLGRPGPNLSVTLTENGISVSGEVGATTWTIFSNAVEAAVAAAAADEDVFIELEGLSFIDAHGIELIARAARELAPNGRLVLRHAPESLRRMAEIARLDRQPGILIKEQNR